MRTPRLFRTALALAFAALAAAVPARAQEHAAGGDAAAAAGHEEEHFDAVHHTSDGSYLDFSPFGKVELPRLFVTRRANGAVGFDAYGSTRAAIASGRYEAVAGEHGGAAAHEAAGEAEGGEHAADVHGAEAPDGSTEAGDHAIVPGLTEDALHPAATDEAAVPEAHDADYLEAGLAPADGGRILVDLSITRHVFFLLLTVVLVSLLLIPMGGRYKRGVGRTSAPRGLLQNVIETLVLYVRDEIAKPNLGDKTNRYLPYLLTAFFFILGANLIGLVPFSATSTANISVTAVLAVFTFLITQAAGTKDYWKHIFWPPGVPTFVKPILIPVELLGIFTKPFALAIRLFANMTAGHLVILNLVGLIFIINTLFGAGAGWGTSVPALGMVLFVYALELLVAFLQAYVFTTLSALFIGMSSAEHEHDHDHTHDHALTPHDVAVSETSPLVSGGRVHHDPQRTVGTEAAISPF